MTMQSTVHQKLRGIQAPRMAVSRALRPQKWYRRMVLLHVKLSMGTDPREYLTNPHFRSRLDTTTLDRPKRFHYSNDVVYSQAQRQTAGRRQSLRRCRRRRTPALLRRESVIVASIIRGVNSPFLASFDTEHATYLPSPSSAAQPCRLGSRREAPNQRDKALIAFRLALVWLASDWTVVPKVD